MDLLFIGFPGIELSHEMQVQFDYASHTCINLYVYNDEKQVLLLNRDFAREKTLPATFRLTSSSLQPATSLQVFRPPATDSKKHQ